MKERWGWSAEKCEAKWNEALSDPQVPKNTDEEGWTTIAKYSNASLGSARSLEHNRKVATSSSTQASQDQLKMVTKDLMETGSLHSHTGVLDITALPSLPGFARFGCGGGAAKVTWPILELDAAATCGHGTACELQLECPLCVVPVLVVL